MQRAVCPNATTGSLPSFSLVTHTFDVTFHCSAGYNAWRDTKKPTTILDELCRTTTALAPVYNDSNETVRIGEQRFTCDPACVEFVNNAKSPTTTLHRKVHHESPIEYIQQNTALAALHAWGRKINSVDDERSLVVVSHGVILCS